MYGAEADNSVMLRIFRLMAVTAGKSFSAENNLEKYFSAIIKKDLHFCRSFWVVHKKTL